MGLDGLVGMREASRIQPRSQKKRMTVRPPRSDHMFPLVALGAIPGPLKILLDDLPISDFEGGPRGASGEPKRSHARAFRMRGRAKRRCCPLPAQRNWNVGRSLSALALAVAADSRITHSNA
eukprot:2026214-Pyramimonas_sp.AAC.1